MTNVLVQQLALSDYSGDALLFPPKQEVSARAMSERLRLILEGAASSHASGDASADAPEAD